MLTPTLSAPEIALLELLTEGRKTTGPVRLAADLWQRGGNATPFDSHVDPVGFVVYLLEGLAELGYLTYRLATQATHDTPMGYYGLPFDVRLTRKGWVECGYPHVHAEVGHTARMREVNPAELTDYRNHGETAAGGPIEALPWWEHQAKYPEHDLLHDYPIQPEEDSLMTRTYMVVSPELEERVVAAFGRHGSYELAAQETNVTIRQAKYILKDRPRLGRDAGSLKMRALGLIRENGPYADVMGLHADLPGPHGLHNLIHVLYSLRSGGLIDFQENQSGGSGSNPLNIRVRKAVELTDAPAEVIPLFAPTNSNNHVEVTVPPTPEVVAPTYPELSRIQELQKEQDKAQGKAGQYLLAAELLADADAETADLLLAKATEIGHTSLSPVEGEYIRYAQEHPDAS